MINPNPPRSALQDVSLRDASLISFFQANLAHFHSDFDSHVFKLASLRPKVIQLTRNEKFKELRDENSKTFAHRMFVEVFRERDGSQKF